ncbi:MAG: protein-glutamate O-methyltransferase CheR [Desulfobulbaceae bacterium]|nr:protein-glutamate O-methyltransferase CheR [Desulfobulbaceae bacterium]
MIAITPKEVELFADFVHSHTGIVLNSTKAYLLESRLGPMLEETGFSNFTDFFYAGYRSSKWVSRVIDAISTHETSFFRDQRPFDLLQSKILPEYFGKRQSDPEAFNFGLQIWCAACSTGQEVYSLAMIIAELLGKEIGQWNVTITGTDISENAIHKARQGFYTSYEVDRGVPLVQRQKYFEVKGEMLKVRDELQRMTLFKKMNLLGASGVNGLYDVILCRNVAIYFNQDNRRRLFETIAACLRPEGVLLIGSTESLHGVSDHFVRKESCNTVYYQAKCQTTNYSAKVS